jgi:hypothetical protein
MQLKSNYNQLFVLMDNELFEYPKCSVGAIVVENYLINKKPELKISPLNIAIQTLFFMLMLVPKKSQKNVEL